MKNLYFTIAFLMLYSSSLFAQVGINSDNSAPDPSAMLDVNSPIKGLLPPRVSLTATNVAAPVSSPAIGLQVYNTATTGTAPYNVNPGIYIWDGLQWVPVIAPKGANAGDMQYWNGTQWVIVPAGTYGQQLYFCDGVPTWGGCPPVLTTTPPVNITANSAVSGGNITLDGGLNVIARGVCWSTIPNPTIADSKTIDGSGTGPFVSNITGLSPNSLYYVRSYATNSAGTGYGEPYNFPTLCEFYPIVSVSIEASTNPVCDGSIVSLQATPINGGLMPVYQWKVNGVLAGTNSSVLMYTPSNNDAVQCILTSSLPCTSTPAISNTINITVLPMLSVGVTIAASANNVCLGDTVTYTATGTNAGTISNYQWKLGGNVISGATNMTYSYVPANNDVITCLFTSNPPCTLNNSATSNSITMTVISPPTTPISGTHVPSQTQIVWNWNPVVGVTGFKWNTINDSTTAIGMGSSTTKTEAGLTCNTVYNRYVWAYNNCGNSSPMMLTQTTSICSGGGGFTCGQSITINHIAGAVAPVNKTTTYGTVTNIPGEPNKCWITSNLGSDHQAASVDDSTEASSGWYWQFNRKQGYKHDGTNLTPPWATGSINEYSDWEQSKDPCDIELGNNWRIPTYSEWINVDNIGGWTSWNGPWYSALKLHAAGYVNPGDGLMVIRGSYGLYWSTIGFDDNDGWGLTFYDNNSFINKNDKACGFPVRCVNENCFSPSSPTQGTHNPSPAQIIWHWNAVTGATGYLWNNTNDYTTATDIGLLLNKTETGLSPNTPYTRYIWAYNSCGESPVTVLTSQTTGFAIGQNFGGGIIFYLDGTGQHGLIAAPGDQSSGTWGCYGTLIGGTSTAIGTGQANTTAIVNGCSELGTAARICTDLILNGYNDWFLPSRDELHEIYLKQGLIGGFNWEPGYWSSSAGGSETSAWWQSYYYNGDPDWRQKWQTFLVRAVRAF
jgi:hypothetical protein